MKKGQLTAFIIIGIVLLLAVIIFVSTQVSKKPGLEEITYPGQQELRSYIDACARPAAIEGMELIRKQAGYIAVPDNTDVLLVGNDQVPYWLTANAFRVPTLAFMENQLADFINDKVKECAKDFSPLKEQGFTVEAGNIDTNVEMADAVIATINYPITMSKADVAFTTEKFIVSLPINMKKIHDIAATLAVYEDRLGFIEEHTNKLISVFSGVDEDKLLSLLANVVCDEGCGTNRKGTDHSIPDCCKTLLPVDDEPRLCLIGCSWIDGNDERAQP